MTTICLEMKTIKTDIAEIKKTNAEFLVRLESIAINSAKYPPPEKVADAMTKLSIHDAFFGIIGVAVGFAWGGILLIFNKLWGN